MWFHVQLLHEISAYKLYDTKLHMKPRSNTSWWLSVDLFYDGGPSTYHQFSADQSINQFVCDKGPLATNTSHEQYKYNYQKKEKVIQVMQLRAAL